jgi:hypothetical protein
MTYRQFLQRLFPTAHASISEMIHFSQDQGNQGIARRRTESYAAQGIPQIDAEIAEKGHFWMETA